MELKELTEKTLELFGITDVSELGSALMKNINDDNKKENFFQLVGCDLTKDWLQMIFQYYQADRNEKKQDYTPRSLALFLSRLIGNSTETIDMCAGSGALTIQRWIDEPDTSFDLYEIDENVIPYLLFNLSIRNITATIHHGDVLQNEYKKIWHIQRGAKYGKVSCIESAI